MELAVFGKDVKLTPSVRTLLRDASDHLDEYFRSVLSIHWDLAYERYELVVSCRVHARSGYFRANSRAKTLRSAVDDVVEKILKQRRRRKVQAVRIRRQAGSRRK